MRDLTEEEYDLVNAYIQSISKPTGINIWDLLEDYDSACHHGV